MQKKELIALDSLLLDVIDESVFRGKLPNGHEFVAVGKDGRGRRIEGLAAGDTVRVAFSPYDMSSGRIVSRSEPTRGSK